MVQHVDETLIAHDAIKLLSFRGVDEAVGNVMHRHAIGMCLQPESLAGWVGSAVKQRLIQAGDRRVRAQVRAQDRIGEAERLHVRHRVRTARAAVEVREDCLAVLDAHRVVGKG